MPKILTAKDILAQKGIAQTKFDTNAFMEQVARFFIENAPNSRLLLFPYRFANIETDPKNDPCTIITSSTQLKNLSEEELRYLDSLETLFFCDNPFLISWENRLQGFKNETLTDKKSNLLYINELNSQAEYDEECGAFIRRQNKFGLLRPRFLIDKPFFQNAAGTLRIMGGYVVEPFRRGGITYYNVSLI